VGVTTPGDGGYLRGVSPRYSPRLNRQSHCFVEPRRIPISFYKQLTWKKQLGNLDFPIELGQGQSPRNIALSDRRPRETVLF
jgi:hypothetical protein